jgi:microcystin degradation protein MlrC
MWQVCSPRSLDPTDFASLDWCMKKIAILRFWYEGNSFSPVVARRADFLGREWTEGDAARDFYAGTGVELAAAVDVLAERRDIAGRFLACAAAYPAGPIEAGLFPEFLDRVDRGLAGQSWDGAYLSLHGAAVCEDVEDAELALLRAVRARLGAAPIAVSFDLHANLSPEVGALAEIVVGYKTYPHVDMYETGRKALGLLDRAMGRQIEPRTLVLPVGFAPSSFNMRTRDGPMAEIVTLAAAKERQHGFHDITAFGGFVCADARDTGASIAVCAERAASEAAAAVAEELSAAFLARAEAFEVRLPAPRAVLRELREGGMPGRVAILEPADNVYSGGVGDTPELLRAVLEEAPDIPSVFAFFWDPELVETARRLGPGAELPCTFGGRLSADYGPPVETRGRIETLTDGRFRNRGPMETGLPVDLGPTAVIRVGNLRIIVTSQRRPVNDPGFFELHGLDLTAYPLVFIKAKNHFRAAFAERFDRIIEVGTPGPAPSDISGLPYRRASLDRLRVGRLGRRRGKCPC